MYLTKIICVHTIILLLITVFLCECIGCAVLVSMGSRDWPVRLNSVLVIIKVLLTSFATAQLHGMLSNTEHAHMNNASLDNSVACAKLVV